ncbi:polysaccharide pyruvyl transferase family protein [Leucothrix mucor]|uniref:polysaccharide pyruvyl transferase family protein n=1 Tax=Leucothrix mucor TaxID=45248 RepID=UPI0003B42A41|nr:polysaccharide pyruvyl transferase family protein [Leucothrix mucor]
MYDLKWWKQSSPVQNFGDYLGEYMASFFSEVEYGQKNSKLLLRNVGSVIANVVIDNDLSEGYEKIVYFGCGARGSKIKPDFLQKCYFCSVRGPLSRALLGLPDDTPIGDSAFMLPMLYEPKESPEGRSGVLLVTHFNETRTDDELLKLTGCDSVLPTVIEKNHESVERLIDQIANSSFVFTSSLHGAIVAAVYNIPFAYWSSSEVNVPFKWKDFSLSIGLDCEFHERLEDGVLWYEKEKIKLIKPDSADLVFRYKKLSEGVSGLRQVTY